MSADRLTPAEMTLRGQIAVHQSWANTSDRSARTAPARARFLDRFEREVDPQGDLPETERQRRAEHARKAYFASLSLKAAKARRQRKQANKRRRANGAKPGTPPDSKSHSLGTKSHSAYTKSHSAGEP